MSRRNAAQKRVLMKDPLYEDKTVPRLINRVMRDGKKSTAERIVYGALEKIVSRGDKEGSSKGKGKVESLSENAKKTALETLKKALENVSPKVEVKSRRVGGSTYQVPVEVRPDRREAVGMRLLVTHAAKRGEKTMVDRLAGEILDASQNRGGAVKKCEDILKMAEANKAFAHYRW